MSVTLEKLDEKTWHISGEMHISTVTELEQQGQKMIEAASAQLIIDLGGVTRSDSTAVALLISWLRQARKKQVKISFQNLPQKMLDNIRVSGLEGVLSL